MTVRSTTVVVSLLGLAFALLGVGLVLGLAVAGDPALAGQDVYSGLLFPPLAIVPFAAVGALVVAKQPGNAVGRLLFAIGATLSLAYLGNAVALWGIAHPDFPQTAAASGGWLSTFVWTVVTAVLMTRLLVVFPDGRPPSPRWRVIGFAQALLLVVSFAISLEAGPLGDYKQLENPFGVAAFGGRLHALEVVGKLLYLLVLVGATVAVVVRFRRSRGVERLQLKWVALSVALVAATIVLTFVVSAAPVWLQDLAWVASALAVCSIPIVIGLAVLRYRLYEIDRLISRTLVYALVTVVLGVAYVGLVLAGQAVFASFSGGSNLAIAVSTLVVAALFLPARARIQRVVDRRFYRRRYDAARTLEAFGGRLREEVDLDELGAELQGVVADTMQPSHVSLWLREEPAR